MLELLGGKRSARVPGPTDMIGSYSRGANQLAGYYGEVSESDLIDVATLLRLTGASGHAASSTTSWLKFYLDGVVSFVSRLPLQDSANWDSYNGLGLVYGQKQVTIQGKQYRCRMFKTFAAGVGQGGTITAGNEWDRLMSNICSQTGLARQEGDKWGNQLFSLEQLGLTQGLGSYTMCQEANTNTSGQIWMRGFNSIAGAGGVFTNQANSYNYMGWRPVLELIP